MGEGAEDESLLISSPIMARGAQPYIAQDLWIFNQYSDLVLRGLRDLRSAEGNEGSCELERGRKWS